MSHDAVWDKSDIDLLLITVDDKKAESSGVALYANGVNVHGLLMSRVVVTGTLEQVAACRASYAGRFLKTHLQA